MTEPKWTWVLDEPRYRYAAKRLNEGFDSADAETVADLLALCRELAGYTE